MSNISDEIFEEDEPNLLPQMTFIGSVAPSVQTTPTPQGLGLQKSLSVMKKHKIGKYQHLEWVRKWEKSFTLSSPLRSDQ